MKPSLLIADGDAELCDLQQRFLSAQGFQVATASDGLDCLEKLRQLSPAVLVLDQELRWGGGVGVLAWLREESAETGVVVVLTATAGALPDPAEDLETPVVRFLPKPFVPAVLLESVRAALAEK